MLDEDRTAEAEAYLRSVLVTLRVSSRASVLEVADAALGTGCYSRAPMREEGSIARVGGRLRLFVNARLSPSRRHWQIAYQLAAWLTRSDAPGVSASALAAALILPRDVVASPLRERGSPEIARALVVPEVATYLRAGELLETPIAHVVIGVYARVRGDKGHVFPTASAELEQLAGPVRALHLRRVLPTDGRGVLLRAA